MLSLRQFRIYVLVLVCLVLVADKVFAQVPLCEERPEFSHVLRDPSRFKNLPKAQFVARSLSLFVESKDGLERARLIYDFKSSKSKVLCQSDNFQEPENLQVWFPGLINIDPDRKLKMASWQVNLLVEPKRLGLWVQPSRFGQTDVVNLVRDRGHWRNLDSSSYELLWMDDKSRYRIFYQLVFDTLD